MIFQKRYARHYYDLYCIANSKYKEKAFEKIKLLEKVVAFKEKFYPRKWARYEDATSKAIRLMPDECRLKEIEEDYKNMSEMFFGEYPSFEDVMRKSGLPPYSISCFYLKTFGLPLELNPRNTGWQSDNWTTQGHPEISCLPFHKKIFFPVASLRDSY